MATIGIACGGTGGHLYPGLAVAEKLKLAGHEVRLYTSNKEIDRKVLEAHPGFNHLALPSIGWPGIGLRTPLFFIQFYRSYQLCVREIREHRLAAVLGMGGFTSAALLLCAARRKIPVLLHESNAIPGKVTKLLATKSDQVLLGIKECADYLPKNKCKVTGTPVRTSLLRVDRKLAAEYWGLEAGRITITVIGGSQGAGGLNQLMLKSLPFLETVKESIQIIHQTGRRDVEVVEAAYRSLGINARVQAFCERMEMLYSLSDIMVARAGAASLTEISAFGIPAILIPYPHAAEDHQFYNAQIFSQAGAAVTIRENDMSSELLTTTLKAWILEPEHRSELGRAASTLNSPDAAERVAQEVLNAL
jgi:UDP-N-acetylglucosamine--N-acetylmuramyl-(pentapeptide) pyrophosphoryl-undecaprenol N-acetylglucosamine transferase